MTNVRNRSDKESKASNREGFLKVQQVEPQALRHRR